MCYCLQLIRILDFDVYYRHKNITSSYFYVIIQATHGGIDMEQLLYAAVMLISRIHTAIMSLNDGREASFTDKELHFIVVGILGILLIFIIYPIFKWLAKSNHTMVIAWIYVFTVIIVLTFAIEIGQGITGTGNMEMSDITSGVLGFLAAFAAFSVIRGIYHLIVKRISKD